MGSAKELFAKKSTQTKVSVACKFMMVDAGFSAGYKSSDFRKKTEKVKQSWEQSTVSQVDNVVIIGLESYPRLDASFLELLRKSCFDPLDGFVNKTEQELVTTLNLCMYDVLERRTHFYTETDLGSAFILVSTIFLLFCSLIVFKMS